MAIYKKLLGSDVSITPFNANKSFTFNSSSGTNSSIKLETYQYRSESLYTYSTNDVSSSLKYFQLDHLYYKDFQLNVANKFGNVDYLNQPRELHDKVNTISVPSKLYGLEIKPGTFSFTTGSLKVVDDKNGNLIISGTQLISHSMDTRQKVFHLGPRNAFKQYDLNANFHGKEQKHPHPLFYYSRKNIYDNSFYNNLLNYKNVKFGKRVISHELIKSPKFTSTDGWSRSGNSKIETDSYNGNYYVRGGAYNQLQTTNNPIEFGKEYELTVDIEFISSSLTGTGGALFALNQTGFHQLHPRGTGGKHTTRFTGTTAYTSTNAKKDLTIYLNPYNGVNHTGSLKYVSLREVIERPVVHFVTTGSNNISSSIVSPHSEKYNFNTGDDFTISMYADIKSPGYLISKSTTQDGILFSQQVKGTKISGSSQNVSIPAVKKFPFEVFVENDDTLGIGKLKVGTWAIGKYQDELLTFRRSDGTNTPTISTPITTGSLYHITCMTSASVMSIWLDGKEMISGSDTTLLDTQNRANLYIGTKGEISNYFSGSIANLMIYNEAKSKEQIKSLNETTDGNPYVGNIFYSQGVSAITNPRYQEIGKKSHKGDYTLTYRGTHPIYENEYQCTVQSDEFNYSHNISTRKIQSDQYPELSDITTGSLWKPYVTTIGLFNENNELLVVGKLGQPIRMSDETDTTFILRWDT